MTAPPQILAPAARDAAVESPAQAGGGAAAKLPSSVRKAALLLHGLEAHDRDWLVARLPESERATLRPLLAELRSLGIPADRALVDEVVAGGRAGPPAESERPPEDPSAYASPGGMADLALVKRIERADAARIAAILRNEPPGLVTRLLALHPWPWSSEVAARLRPARARDTEESNGRRQAAAGPVTPLLAKRLMAALEERLNPPEPAPRASERAPVSDSGASRGAEGEAEGVGFLRLPARWVRRLVGGDAA